MTPSAGARRPSLAERRERRAAVDDPAVVLEAAARFLEPRARSVAEVRRRLTGAGYRADLVDGVIERLLEFGMLDDEAFARAWVESRDRARPRGERAIRQELGLKGVDRTTIDLVLEERREAVAGVPVDDDAARPRHRIASRPSACWRATPARSPAWPTLASAGSVPTRCSRATASTRTSAGRSRRRWPRRREDDRAEDE